MAVNALGSLGRDDPRLASSVTGIAGNKPEKDFARILEAARSADKASSDQAASPAKVDSKKTKKPMVDKTDTLYEQCEALESFLIKNLLNGMRATVQKSELIDEGLAGKMYEDMLYDEYAKDYTKNANFGLAELAYLELTKQRGGIILG
jgi:flagellar protein FlgJ